MKKIKWSQFLEQISKCFFWINTIVFILFAIYEIVMSKYVESIVMFAWAIFLCPLFLDKVFKRVGGKPDYFYFFTVLFGSIGWFVATQISLKFGDESVKGLQISMYIIYLIFLFMIKKVDKNIKYKVFGIWYGVFIALSFMPETLIQDIIRIMNMLFQEKFDKAVYDLLFVGFIEPIKEAILTYIIFDTIIENVSNNSENIKNVRVTTMKEVQQKKERENYILIENDKIVIENITADIELEINDLCISIHKKLNNSN